MPQIITTQMSLGSPGDITRDIRESTVEANYNSSTVPVLGFGLPLKLGAQPMSVTGIVGGDVAASIVGFSVRQYPSYPGGNMANLGLGQGIPNGPVSTLKKGYMAVKCNNGVPVKEGLVYVRISAPAGAKVVGGIEAAADGANTIIVPNCQFMGPADADGNAEIRFNV